MANIIPQQQQAYLIFPPVAGHYSTLGDTQDYYLTGKNVVINPNRNEVTESNNVTKTNYSLNVSGTINTQNYYVGGHAGLNDIIVAYHPSDLQWYNMTMSSGMLIGSNSTTSPVVGGGITPGASYNISTSYASGSTSSSFSATASYIDYSNSTALIDTDSQCIIGFPVESLYTYFFTSNIILPSAPTKIFLTGHKSLADDTAIVFGVNTNNSTNFDD